MTASRNPFRSSRLRPGVVPYVFSEGKSLDDLMQRLAGQRYWGQIIGPHGSGKSTLVQSVKGRLLEQGCEVVHGSFQGGSENWNVHAVGKTNALKTNTRQRVVIIDGFEQLTWLRRQRWKTYCRFTGRGLIVTAHQSIGLPELYRTGASREIALQVVTRLAGHAPAGISHDDVTQAFQSQGGNLRDTLFALYDLYETRRPATTAQ